MFWVFILSLGFNSSVAIWWHLDCCFTFHNSTLGLKPGVLMGNTCFLFPYYPPFTPDTPVAYFGSLSAATRGAYSDRVRAQHLPPWLLISLLVPSSCTYDSLAHIFSHNAVWGRHLLYDVAYHLTFLNISVRHKHSCVSPFGNPHLYLNSNTNYRFMNPP